MITAGEKLLFVRKQEDDRVYEVRFNGRALEGKAEESYSWKLRTKWLTSYQVTNAGEDWSKLSLYDLLRVFCNKMKTSPHQQLVSKNNKALLGEVCVQSSTPAYKVDL